MQEAVMYFVVNEDLIKQMGIGKTAAQVAHAAIKAYNKTAKNALYHEWRNDGGAKVVLRAPESVMKDLLERYPDLACPIVDEGRTRVDPGSFTVLGFVVMRKGELKELSELKLAK